MSNYPMNDDDHEGWMAAFAADQSSEEEQHQQRQPKVEQAAAAANDDIMPTQNEQQQQDTAIGADDVDANEEDSSFEPAAKRARTTTMATTTTTTTTPDDATSATVPSMPPPPPQSSTADDGVIIQQTPQMHEAFMRRVKLLTETMVQRDSRKKEVGSSDNVRPITTDEWMDLDLSSHLAFPLKTWSAGQMNMFFQFINVRTLQQQCTQSFAEVYHGSSDAEKLRVITCPWALSSAVPTPPPTARGYVMGRTRDFMAPPVFMTGFTSPPFPLVRPDFESKYLEKTASSAFPTLAIRPRETVAGDNFTPPPSERMLASIDQSVERHLAAVISHHNDIVTRSDYADIVSSPEKCKELHFTTSEWGRNVIKLSKMSKIMRYDSENKYPPITHFFCTWQPQRTWHSLLKRQMLAPYRVACVFLDYHARLVSAIAEARGATPWSPQMTTKERSARIREMKAYLSMTDDALERTLRSMFAGGTTTATMTHTGEQVDELLERLRNTKDEFCESINDVAIGEENDDGDTITFTYPKDAPQINRSRQPETNFLLGVERTDEVTGEVHVETHRVLPVHHGDEVGKYVRDLVTGGIVWRFIGPEDIPMYAKISVVGQLSQVWTRRENVSKGGGQGQGQGQAQGGGSSDYQAGEALGQATMDAGVKLIAREVRITPDLERERQRREQQEAGKLNEHGGPVGENNINPAGELFGNTSTFADMNSSIGGSTAGFDVEKSQQALNTLLASRENDEQMKRDREERKRQFEAEKVQGGGGGDASAGAGAGGGMLTQQQQRAMGGGGRQGNNNNNNNTDNESVFGGGSSGKPTPPAVGDRFLSGVNPPM